MTKVKDKAAIMHIGGDDREENIILQSAETAR